jgi:hypothetical protein
MRGTRRTIVTAAAGFAVVLGVGGVAAAASRHGSHDASKPQTSIGAHHTEVGTDHSSARVLDASSTTADSETSSTLDDDTSSTTMEDTSSTVLGDTTSTTVAENEPGDARGDVNGHDHGSATEEAHENENAALHEHEQEATSTTVGSSAPQNADTRDGNPASPDHSGPGHDGGSDGGHN